jgi:hypothetical protein
MIKHGITVGVFFVLSAAAFAVAPSIINIGDEVGPLGPGRLPAIAVDSRMQPHIVTDGGSFMHMYSHVGGSWRSLSKNVRNLVNSPQFYNPHIEIDSLDRAWISGTTWQPAGGVGIVVRTNVSTDPSDFDSMALSRAGARFPVGLLSIDPAFPDEGIAMGTAGGWQRVFYDANGAGSVRLADSGRLPVGASGEKIAFWISKAGSVQHPNGRNQAVWHAAMGGYYNDYSAYINSLMQARGQGRMVWAAHPSYPTMTDDGAYVRVVSDATNPEIAYITCDFSAGGRHGGAGVGMNIYNGIDFNFSANNILMLDRAGTAGLRRFAPQSAPAKDGGVFVTWNRAGRIIMRYVPATARSISDLGPEWDFGPGGPAAIAVDGNGDVHLAYTRGGMTYYRLIEMAGSSPISSFAIDFTGDGRDDPAEFNAARGTLFLHPGSVGFGETINVPFVQAGDIPVFIDHRGNTNLQFGVYRPTEGLWKIYRGDIRQQPFNPQLLTNFYYGGGDRGENDIPVAGIFDIFNDEKENIPGVGYYRPSEGTWRIRPLNNTWQSDQKSIEFGATNGIPLVGPWVDSNRDSIVIWHPDEMKFHIYDETFPRDGLPFVQYGGLGDIPVPADYDGDGLLDIAVYRPGTGQWFISPSDREKPVIEGLQWGAVGDVPAPGRYTYDNKADIAVLRRNELYIRSSEEDQPELFGLAPFRYGGANHIPIPADYDGSGIDNIAAFDIKFASWHIFSELYDFKPFVFGAPDDVPVPGYYDEDDVADVAVFRPSTAQWFIWSSSSETLLEYQFGAPGDLPAQAAYFTSNRTELAVFRPQSGSWYIWNSLEQRVKIIEGFGTIGDLPVPADYTGDGRANIAVYRPSDSTWHIRISESEPDMIVQFGPVGSSPAAGVYSDSGSASLGIYDQGWWWITTSRYDEPQKFIHSWGPIVMPGSGSFVGARRIR